eukprot:2544564-Pyramimonas_sp.AAC.1
MVEAFASRCVAVPGVHEKSPKSSAPVAGVHPTGAAGGPSLANTDGKAPKLSATVAGVLTMGAAAGASGSATLVKSPKSSAPIA